MRTDRLERGLTFVLTACAIVIAIIGARREFFASPTRRSPTPPPTFEPAWRDALPAGLRSGDSAAPVTIVVFSDLECPACAAFHQSLRAVVRAHEHEVSTVFVHFPLAAHRFAVPAARAAECAHEFGRFSEFEDVVYEKQDSLGIKSWGSHASEAGIVDTAGITACARDSRSVDRIEAGRALGLRWEVRGTPSVLINGHRYEIPPSREDMEQEIRRALRG